MPKAVVPSTQPQVGKSTGTPLQPVQPNKGGSTAPAGRPAVGSGVPGIPGGSSGAGAGIKVNPPGAVGRPPVGNNPATVKPGGSTIPGGQKIETAKPSTGIGPAPTGVGRPGNPLGGQGVNTGKATGNPTGSPTGTLGNSLPGGRGSGGKPKISVEPGAGQQTLGGKGGSLPLDPKGTLKLNPQPDSTGRPKLDPKGTVKLNPQPEPPGQLRPGTQDALKLGSHEKMKPLVVSKNGGLKLDPSKSGRSPAGGKAGATIDADKLKASQPDDKLHSLLQAQKRGDLTRELKQLRESPDPQAHAGMKHLNLDKISGVHQERLAKLDN
ncbi:MAG: hypothetical protein H7062_19165, partial [Candidatus Saccharimonas sp.]|nr:hypothetical protein [Planctomycetaceae bacterium]